MTDLPSFSAWLVSATRAAILVVRERVYQARRLHPERRSEANAILKRSPRSSPPAASTTAATRPSP